MGLDFTNFSRTDLSSCLMQVVDLDGCYFEKTILKYANFLQAHIRGNCLFKEVDFEGCLFRHTHNGSRYFGNYTGDDEREEFKKYSVPNISADKLTKAYILEPHSDLSHADFSRIQALDNLNRIYLGGLNLSYANLSHANLSLANLSHTNLGELDLTKIPPTGFKEVNFSHANLNHAILIKQMIAQGNLQQAQLNFCQVICTVIRDTDFSGSSLRYASFKNSHLRNVSFQDCQFEHTDFTNTYIYGDAQIPPEVDLSQAHLLPADAPYPDPLFG
ncbi:Pentapeptide repeat family protein [Geitlerinema sp. FC II]|nr:Pentapeptide repeat family protein [Geitlerinema sp. FC II]